MNTRLDLCPLVWGHEVIYKHIHDAAYGLKTHVRSLAIDGTVL